MQVPGIFRMLAGGERKQQHSLSSTERKVILSDYYSALTAAGIGMHGRAKPWSIDRAITEGYERVGWVFRSVDTIAGNAARVDDLPFRYRRPGKDGDYDDENPMCHLLNRRANPMEDARAFRKRLFAQVLLSKPGAFVEISRTNGGDPYRLDLLPPGRTRIVPGTGADPISHYEVRRTDGSMFTLAPEDVRWVRDPHPTDPYSGVTPLEAAGMSVELDYFARLYNVSFMRNDGRPGGILAVDGDMDEEDMDRIEDKFGRGPVDAGRLSVIAGQLSYVDVAARPRDMQYVHTAKNSKDEILSFFGVAESVMGNASGRTFANAETELYGFWSITMRNILSLVASAFDDNADDTLLPLFDTEAIEVLQIPKQKARAEAREEVTLGLRSIESYIRFAGRGDEIESTPETRALWIPSGKAPLAATEADKIAMGQAPDPNARPEPAAAVEAGDTPAAVESGGVPAIAAAPVGDPAAIEQAPDAPALFASATEVPAAAAVTPRLAPAPAQTKALQPSARSVITAEVKAAAPWLEIRPADTESAAEAAIADALTTLVVKWTERTVMRLRSPKVRKGTRHWSPEYAVDTRVGTKALDAAYSVAEDQAAAETDEATRSLVEEAALAAAAAYLTATAASGVIPGVPAVPGAALGAGAAAAGLAALYGAPAGEDGSGPLWEAMRAGDAITVDMLPADVVQAIRQQASAAVPHLVSGARGQSRKVSAAITALDAAGEPIEDVVVAVRGLASDLENWAKTAAAQAAGSAVEVGHDAAAATVAGAGGVDVQRQWLSRLDERVRDTHHKAHGQKRPLGEPFTVGYASLRFPRDPLGPPGETRSCRCKVVYRHKRTGRFVPTVKVEAAS